MEHKHPGISRICNGTQSVTVARELGGSITTLLHNEGKKINK